jgi:hypothetical protein
MAQQPFIFIERKRLSMKDHGRLFEMTMCAGIRNPEELDIEIIL